MSLEDADGSVFGVVADENATSREKGVDPVLSVFTTSENVS